MEVLHQGWLIKSPPWKRLWRAKWRLRWFVLRQSNHIPGQYLLEYYTDSNCKKLKGRIDLDQCEQVDIGIQLESRKGNYQFVFDIRTPKRVYVLVAETEIEMNKWADYICSVCGLQIHGEEEEKDGESATESSVSSIVNQPQQSLSTDSFLANDDSLEPPESPSSSYIPMSECISGKTPIFGNGFFVCDSDHLSTLDETPPPPPKIKNERNISGEFYDYPRQIHPPELNEMDSKPDDHDFGTHSGVTGQRVSTWSGNDQTAKKDANFTAPRVNWDTYPKDSECSDSSYGFIFTKNSATKSTCSLVKGFSQIQLNNGKTTKHAQEIYENISSHTEVFSETRSQSMNGLVPPRPPKPRHLAEPVQCYQNISLNTKVLPSSYASKINVNSYDIPPPQDATSKNSNSIQNVVPNIVGSLSNLGASSACLDEMYDFPRPMSSDHLHATPPAPSGSLTRQTKHAYSNAPAGYMTDNVFTYDAHDVNVLGENYLSMNVQKSYKRSEVYTDMSGENKSPSVVYSNLPSPVGLQSAIHDPPRVNRDLKPKKVTSDNNINHSRSCSSASSTDVSAKSPSPVECVLPPVINRGLKPKRNLETPEKQNLLPLAPPPVYKIHSREAKRSFRKPRTIVAPPLPNSNQYSDLSSSEDDHSSAESSRRNSASEEQKFFPSSLPVHNRVESEIQYLDLDLASNHVQSPKSPERSSTSTVYKTVDFVKTKAFIEMRQNVEETYRKSQ